MTKSALHQLKICHRFLSPSAILISGTGHCKIARLHRAALVPNTGKLTENVGVPDYKAPEVLDCGNKKGIQQKVWGLIVFI